MWSPVRAQSFSTISLRRILGPPDISTDQIATVASLAEAQRALRPAYAVRTRGQRELGADFTALGIAIRLSKVTRRPAVAGCQNSALALVAARRLTHRF